MPDVLSPSVANGAVDRRASGCDQECCVAARADYCRPSPVRPYIARGTCFNRPRFLLIAYALVLSIEAGANIAITFVGKGRTWDPYPLAELFWIACSVAVVITMARRPSMKRLAW